MVFLYISYVVGPWDSHVVIPPGLNTEIVIHGHHSEANNSGHHSEANNSTSAETVIDSDLEFKPVISHLFYILFFATEL